MARAVIMAAGRKADLVAALAPILAAGRALVGIGLDPGVALAYAAPMVGAAAHRCAGDWRGLPADLRRLLRLCGHDAPWPESDGAVGDAAALFAVPIH